MTKLIRLTLCSLLITQLSCAQNTQTEKDLKMDVYKQNTIDESEPKIGNYIQINSQNCHYEIRINDMETSLYQDREPAMSIRIPFNSEILESGEQKLSVRVTPLQGNTLSPKADLSLRLFYYLDMTDEKYDYGGTQPIMEWELPQVSEDVPYVQLDTVFYARVPYRIKNMKYAVDLSKMDKDELLKEVVAKYTNFLRLIKTDYDRFNEIHRESTPAAIMTIYTTEEEMKQVRENNKKSYTNPEDVADIQPLENYELKLYGYGKIASLRRLSDGGNVICKAQVLEEDYPPYYKKGDKYYYSELPIFIYKDKRDNRWHTWK